VALAFIIVALIGFVLLRSVKTGTLLVPRGPDISREKSRLLFHAFQILYLVVALSLAGQSLALVFGMAQTGK